MKIKQEELEKLNNFLEDIKKLKEVVANCELEIRKVNKLKEEAFNKLDAVKDSMDSHLNKITEEYGPININLEDGSYEAIEQKD